MARVAIHRSFAFACSRRGAAACQPCAQRPSFGFPILRVVFLLAFATAKVLEAAMGPYAGKETDESALFRPLTDQVRADDVVVADRYYCSYCMITLLLQRGADAAFRLHQKTPV